MTIALDPLDRSGLARAQALITEHHYRHCPVDPRSCPEGYSVIHWELEVEIGVLLFGRPEATRCYPWYGSVEDVQSGRAEITRWQVLNLARVWLAPGVQKGGEFYGPDYLPGFTDRRGVWRSTLASAVIGLALGRIGYDYLSRRPPVFLDEPYEIRDCLSYCDPTYHKGVIYQASGFEHYRTAPTGMMTWRIRLPGLTEVQDFAIREASRINPRARGFRARRAQTNFLSEVKHG